MPPSGSGPAGAERRETVRHPIEVPVEITVGREMAIHVTHDLSGRGAFFNHAIPYAVGTLVRLRVELPGDSEPVFCAGEIVNVPDSRSYGMGVQFIGISEAVVQRVEAFAQTYAKRRAAEE